MACARVALIGYFKLLHAPFHELLLRKKWYYSSWSSASKYMLQSSTDYGRRFSIIHKHNTHPPVESLHWSVNF